MKKEDAIDILDKNIGIFSQRGDFSRRQRNICISHIIDLILKDSENSTLQTLYESFLNSLNDATFSDKALFWKKTLSLKRYTPLNEWIFGAPETPVVGSYGKISVVHNQYNDIAFSAFSKILTYAKAYYLSSFSETCEEVFDGKSEFCVLPIENTHDGRLFGFYSMIDRYELKICAAYDIDTDSSLESIRYALVGKSTPSRIPANLKWNFEFSISAESGNFIAIILDSAKIFDATLLKIDSLPVLYDDNLQRFYFTFSISEKSAAAFNMFLLSEFSGYNPIGFYPILTVNNI